MRHPTTDHQNEADAESVEFTVTIIAHFQRAETVGKQRRDAPDAIKFIAFSEQDTNLQNLDRLFTDDDFLSTENYFRLNEYHPVFKLKLSS